MLMQLLRSLFAKKKEPPKSKPVQWCYVGRATLIDGTLEWPWWVYLHPDRDEWWFVRKTTGKAYPMGSYQQWTKLYLFDSRMYPNKKVGN